uniref:DDE-1 domain-containing protein n=1 Tax=Glossina brevipalpis TaxID=37001 RepID=A0A1A9WG41_9MUSC
MGKHNGNDDYIVDTESSAEKRVICDTKVDEYQLSYSENISEYWCNELPKVLRSYSGDCIFSVNVAKLLYKSLPMHHSIDEAAVAIQKLPVPQLTLLFFCNALGSYKRVFAIGKVKIPSHLSNINLPVKYFVTSQAQMQPMLWNLILKSLDDEMIAINKRIMLIVNSNLGRMLNCELQNVNVSILPGTDIDSINPDQPLQQGIIGSFKMQYMRILMNKQLLGLEKGKKLQEFLKSITIFDALFYIKKAWSEVTPNIIKSSFEKVGGHRVSSEGVIKDLNRASPAFKFIGKESLDCNEFENTHMIQDTKRKFTNCDDLVNGNDFEKFAEENFSPTLKEALVALEVLQNYCQHRNADVNNSLDKIEEYLLQTTIQRCI